MSRAKRDHNLIEEFARDHAAGLYRYAYRLCGTAEAAEDLVQETFCEAWRSIRTLRDPRRGKAWLFQILRHRYAHTVRDQSRRVQPQSATDQMDSLAGAAGPDVLQLLSDQEMLEKALAAMEDHYKEPFLMVFQEGFRCREVAELLELPLGTVLSRVHRARLLLRQHLRALEPSDDGKTSTQASAGSHDL